MSEMEKSTQIAAKAEKETGDKEAKVSRRERRAERKAAGRGGKKKKRVGLIVALALVVLFVGYNVVSGAIAKNTPMQVNTITASLGDVEETMSTSGTVSSEESKTYYAPVGAMIETMEISLGDAVEEGQQLVTFNTKDLENQQAKAALDASATANGYKSAQYQSDKNQSEYNEATIGLEELKALAESQEQYVQGLKYELEDSMQKEKEKLQDWLGKLNLELEIQNNKLSEQGDPEARDGIQEVIQNLNNSIRETTNQLNDLSMSEGMKEKQRLIDAEQKKLDDMNEEVSRRESKESSSEAGIADAYAKQQQADTMQSAQITAEEAADELAKAQNGVVAEFSGIVTKIATVSSSTNAGSGGGLLEGATVAAGTELFTIESNEQVKVGIEVTRYDLPKIAVGQKAELTIADKTYEGEVSKINKVAAANAQGSAVVGAEIHINNPDDAIYLGVEAKVVIHTNAAENVITLPVEVVNADKQGDFCYVVENGVVVMRRIVTGISSDTMVEVKEGLKEGDQVVYDMTGMVMEGMNVTAVPMDMNAAGSGVAETEGSSGTQEEETAADESIAEEMQPEETQPAETGASMPKTAEEGTLSEEADPNASSSAGSGESE